MKVKIIKTGEVQDFNPAYALRLIEQGKAVRAPAAADAPQGKEKAEKSASGGK